MFKSVLKTFNFILKLFRLNANIFHLSRGFPRLVHFGFFVLCQTFICETWTTWTCKNSRNLHTSYNGYVFKLFTN